MTGDFGVANNTTQERGDAWFDGYCDKTHINLCNIMVSIGDTIISFVGVPCSWCAASSCLTNTRFWHYSSNYSCLSSVRICFDQKKGVRIWN